MPQRILIYGVTGSGKSTLAEQVGLKTGLPVVLVDELMWEPDWKELDRESQRAKISEVLTQECWVMDSAYGKWTDLVLPHVQLMVALDYPRWVSFWRLLKRSVLRVGLRQKSCNGNQESLRKLVSLDSILLWHFRSFKSKRKRIHSWQTHYPHIQLIVLRSPKETDAWLRSLV